MNPELREIKKPAPYLLSEPTGTEGAMHMYDEPYLRWYAVRELNPFIYPDATGFEGYFVGLNYSTEQVAQSLAQLGATTLRTLRMLHRSEPMFMSKLWKVVKGELKQGEAPDQAILSELDVCLSANIARLRLQVAPERNKKGHIFRKMIAQMVQGEHIQYLSEGGVVHGHIMPIPTRLSTEGRVVRPQEFRTQELSDGYLFMQSLGKAGYPLLRLAFDEWKRAKVGVHSKSESPEQASKKMKVDSETEVQDNVRFGKDS